MKLISAVSFLLLLSDARVASGSPSIRGGVIETDQERKLQVSLKASFFIVTTIGTMRALHPNKSHPLISCYIGQSLQWKRTTLARQWQWQWQ